MKQQASIYWPVRLQVASAAGKRIIIRAVKVVQYTGLSAAARRLGVSATQIKRHVSGEQPSMRLARRMAEKGVEVAV